MENVNTPQTSETHDTSASDSKAAAQPEVDSSDEDRLHQSTDWECEGRMPTDGLES